MADIKITDLVDPEEIRKLQELDLEFQNLISSYTKTAKALAEGLKVEVKCVGDIDMLEKLYIDKTKEASEIQQKLNSVMEQQRHIVANTTNTVARHLMERERLNKTTREEYTEQEKVKQLLDRFHDTYEEQSKSLVKITRELEENKKAQKENEKALASGKMSMAKFTDAQAELIAEHRSLTQEKRTLMQIMTAEEKAAQSQEGSYVHMSQQLELLKKAYKDLSEEGRNADFGKELESAIQNLDAHLKDVAADMGEFQRNVGNYAIAGQQGVVATESVIAAMNQEAKTTQDLIDQTKILEEAKLMLNKEDANYQSTLDAVNAKIEENKRKLMDVSDILGKEARTVAEAEAQNKRLGEAMKHIDLTSSDAKKKLEEMRAQIERNNQTIAQATGANEKFADSMLSMIGVNGNFGKSLTGLETSGNFLDGMRTKVAAFGKTLLGLLANPWVLTFLGITGVVAGFKWWYDYNKGLIEASRLTQNFTGLTGEAADKVTADTQAIADNMGKGFDATMGAANTLAQQFGLSWEEALTKIKDGIEAGADMNGRFIENIEQFAPALRDAGVSVDEFVSILAETRNGIFNEKGVQDIIKGGTRLRAMTKQISESLDACGISSKQMQKDLEEGNITMLEAVQQVASKLKELPENSQEAGQVMKNVFGRTAAEGGTLLIQSIADVNTNLDEAKRRMGELGKVNRAQLEAQAELNETLASVFKMSGTSFEEMTAKAKTYVTQGLTKIIKGCVDIYNWFVDLYNESLAVRSAVNNIALTFKTLWEVAKFTVRFYIDSFKAVGTMIEGVVTLNWEKVRQGWNDGLSALKKDAMTMAGNIASDVADTYNNTMEHKLKKVTVGLNADISGTGGGNSGQNGKGKASDIEKIETDAERKAREKEAAKASKEAEKRAKEELKRIHELEESKIDVMADGHEKELAIIRLKFKKKIDEISKDGETEKALRLQLAEQCEKEINDCELKYQQELSKINLENRLAAVKKGSQEELTLKLAQLEASRAEELKAAEKTGADINLINAKYKKERQDLEEEYAAKAASQIEDRYAKEQSIRDNAYMDDLNALKQKYAEELKMAKGNSAKQEAITSKFEDDQARLAEKYARDTAQASIDMLDEVLKNEKLSVADRLKFEQALAKAKRDLEAGMADAAIEEIERVTRKDKEDTEERKARAQQWLEAAAEALNSINDIIGNSYEGRLEKIEEEQEANTAAGEAEQERISQMVEQNVITQEEGEARKRAAEAKTAQKNEELEKKKAKLKERQAKFDKLNSIAQAGIATALALMKLWVNPGWPKAIPLMAVVSALGALQLATILATPLPKYAKGTDYHKGGPAIVGDGGVPEVISFNGRAWLTPDKPTLVDIPVGASVIPDMASFRASDFAAPTPVPSVEKPAPKPYNDTKILDRLDSLIYVTKKEARARRQADIDSQLARYILDKNL